MTDGHRVTLSFYVMSNKGEQKSKSKSKSKGKGKSKTESKEGKDESCMDEAKDEPVIPSSKRVTLTWAKTDVDLTPYFAASSGLIAAHSEA